MPDMFLRSPRRKQVFIALHPAEAKDILCQLLDVFTDAELDQITEAIIVESEKRESTKGESNADNHAETK